MFYSGQGLYVVGDSLFTVGSLYDYVIHAVLIATRFITNDLPSTIWLATYGTKLFGLEKYYTVYTLLWTSTTTLIL